MSDSDPSIRARALEEEVIFGLDAMPPAEQAEAIRVISRALGKRASNIVELMPSGPAVKDMVHGVAQDANWLVSKHLNSKE